MKRGRLPITMLRMDGLRDAGRRAGFQGRRGVAPAWRSPRVRHFPDEPSLAARSRHGGPFMSASTASAPQPPQQPDPRIESLSAITLATSDMQRAVAFYDALGFPIKFGGPLEAFT